jgi:PAS domain S-box-containing protein
LFQITSEAVIIVDQTTKKIIEANPAAGQIAGISHSSMPGQAFVKLFHNDSRDVVLTLLSDLTAAPQTDPVRVRFADGRSEYTATASLFRQDNATHVLVRLVSINTERPVAADDSKQHLLRVLNRIPDAFVLTDDSLTIIDSNLAFLELVQLVSAEAAKGQSLSRFIGRQGIDIGVLTSNLREHGWVRNFGTTMRFRRFRCAKA